jgi:hypothetical protein
MFVLAPELVEWALAVLVSEAGPLYNPAHAHLANARIAALWTNVPNTSRGRRIVARAEKPSPPARAGKWERELWKLQLLEHGGGVEPDFRLIFDATLMAAADEASFCATVEHELLHCGQKLGPGGAPAYDRKTGRPRFRIVGHDVEEFVEIVRRYGVGAAAGDTAALVEAAKRPPVVGRSSIAGACGTCLRRVA